MSGVIPFAAPSAPRFRVTRTTAALPQSAQTAMFTVTGCIRVVSVVGRITTVIQSQATTLKLTANPTTGADSDMCATGDLNAQPAGTILAITGTLATALQISATEGALPDQVTALVVQPGTIDAVTVASSTGAIEWSLTYEPVTADGAAVAA